MAHVPGDVAIVGAGPAGAWAAYHLARAGARVLVFDGSHPREKPCGGGITSRALALVSEVLHKFDIDAVPVDIARFHGDHGEPVAVPLAPTGPGSAPALLVASRRTFDGALLQAAVDAGALFVPERVVDLAIDAAGVLLVTRRGRWRVPVVLGADGVTSLVRRRVVGPFARGQLSLAAGVYALGMSAREVIIRFLPNWQGYCWSFPRPDHLALGACAPARAATSAGLVTLVVQGMHASGLPSGRAVKEYAWPIPTLASGDFDRERPAGDRWMLLGDAAGLVDPLTREGIYYALRSAELAARALARDGSAARTYTTALADTLYPELRCAAEMTHGFFRPTFLNLLMEALAESPSIRAVMADLVAGRQSYRSLKRRLLATRQWRLAWRVAQLKLSRKERDPAPP